MVDYFANFRGFGILGSAYFETFYREDPTATAIRLLKQLRENP